MDLVELLSICKSNRNGHGSDDFDRSIEDIKIKKDSKGDQRYLMLIRDNLSQLGYIKVKELSNKITAGGM